MKIIIKPYLRWNYLKAACLMLILGWAISATVLLILNRPKTLIIGIDENGARVITTQGDPVQRREKLNFLKEFLFYFYNYSSETYDVQVSHAGTLMKDGLWQENHEIFAKIEKQAKENWIVQESRILDLREINKNDSGGEFEADMAVSVKSRLIETKVKYRIVLEVAPHKRSEANPYPWEVVSFHETRIE